MPVSNIKISLILETFLRNNPIKQLINEEKQHLYNSNTTIFYFNQF